MQGVDQFFLILDAIEVSIVADIGARVVSGQFQVWIGNEKIRSRLEPRIFQLQDVVFHTRREHCSRMLRLDSAFELVRVFLRTDRKRARHTVLFHQLPPIRGGRSRKVSQRCIGPSRTQ